MTGKNTTSGSGTSSSTTTNRNDAQDRAVELYNHLERMSQTSPPQVDFAFALNKAHQLVESLGGSIDTNDPTRSTTKQTENV